MASVMSFSATLLSSLHFASVVLILSYLKSWVAWLARSALLWLDVLLSFL